ncbi:hypothetical protein CerSpe_187260 [Prunus speciosa]
MGKGTLGQVLECWDRAKKEMVAIKIVPGEGGGGQEIPNVKWVHSLQLCAITELSCSEGAASRESIRAVQKLPRLQNLVMQHVDHSARDLIHLLQGLL